MGNGRSLETLVRRSYDEEKTMTVKREAPASSVSDDVGVYWNTAYKVEQVTSLCSPCHDEGHPTFSASLDFEDNINPI